MMNETKGMEGDFARIGGINFQGEMSFSQDVMKIDITQFKKGSILSVEIDNKTMQKEFKRYLVFTQVNRLFKEIACCEKLEVSDEGCLILPIEVMFKEEILPLKIEIPLEQIKFQSQSEKLSYLYMKLDKLNKYYSSLQKQRHHWIKQSQAFQAERQKFQIIKSSKSSTTSQQNTIIQPIFFNPPKNDSNYKVGDNILQVVLNSICHHGQTIPKQGIYYYKFKILSSATKALMVGLCGKNISNLTPAGMTTSDYFMGLYLANGHYYAYGTSIQGPKPYEIKGDSIVKVLINMNEKTVMWYIDDKPVYLAMMRQTLFDVYLYPVIILYTANDKIQFLEK